MRVCFLNHTLDMRTGAGRFCRSLLTAFNNLDPGFAYVVLTDEASGASDERPILPQRWSGLARALPGIRRAFRACDLIHALDGYPYGPIAEVASLGLGKPRVITAIGTGALRSLKRPFAGMLLRMAYRRAERVVAVSRYTAGELEREVPGLRVAGVINHGVDAGEFMRENISEVERVEIEKLQPYILSVGALKPRKGYRYSLEAFTEIHKSYPSLRYVIVGDGPERGNLESGIKNRGLDGTVVLLPQVPQDFLAALYRNAELFVLLPYDDDRDVEGFGLVFLEAAASGVPVIGTRDSGAADAVAEGRNGFIVPPADASAAAGAMRRMLTDHDLRARLASGSREFAREMSWERAARAYLNLYASLS